MKNYTRSELGVLMRLESEKVVMLTAFLFLTVASLWSHLALGPVILQPSLYLALLLIHGAGFVSQKMKNLERFLITVSMLAVIFYFRNCFVNLRVPFLPIAPVFFIVSAVTLTGYGQSKYFQAALRWAFGWGCAFYFTSFHGTEPQALTARSPLFFGMLISFLFFVSFFLAVEIFGRRLEGASAALGARQDYGDKRIHASKLQTLGELAASIAHEINTPLTSIKGYNYQFKSELTETENPDKALLMNFSDRIAFNLDRVAQITKVLRSFSRDSSREEIGVISLREVFDDTLTLLKHHLRSSGIDLVTDMAQEDVFVRGSLVQLSQLLVNLLTNARDALKDSKQKRIIMGFSSHTQQVQMWVEDTGPGIPENIREEVFRPFFTTKGSSSGTGLGLYISQLIAEKHSTQLKFECPKNVETGEMLGTRFYVELQRVSAPAQASKKAA
jgi:signal transduction histidine kinase